MILPAKHVFLILCSLFTLSLTRAQSIDDIVSKHITALGGKAAITSIKSIVLESTVTVMGNDLDATTTILNGKGFKSETNFNGSKIVQCVTDTGGWMINPLTGNFFAEALPKDQLKGIQQQINVGGPLFNYAAKGNKVELTGTDANDYQLRVTNSAGLDARYFISKTTFLIDKLINKVFIRNNEAETTIEFSDYRKTDVGFVMPFVQNIKQPQTSLTITHKKIEINKPVDPSVFAMPRN